MPILTRPVKGAFGSEFHTTFAAWNTSATSAALVYGLERSCPICLIQPIPPEHLIDVPVFVPPQGTLDSLLGAIIPSGSPGRFVYVPVEQAKTLTTGLRVHDITRAALNLGTEIPVVRERELVTTEVLALPNVPIDSHFRNTLRIYATAETEAVISFITNFPVGPSNRVERTVHLAPGRHLFEPAYAAVSDFPVLATNTSPITVTIAQPTAAGAPPPPQMWAFITITNNETQAITTITPQR